MWVHCLRRWPNIKPAICDIYFRLLIKAGAGAMDAAGRMPEYEDKATAAYAWRVSRLQVKTSHITSTVSSLNALITPAVMS